MWTKSKSQFTVFIPTNDAFASMPTDIGSLDDNGYVASLFQYHVIHGRHEKRSFRNEATYSSLRQYDEENTPMKVRINIYQNATVYTASGSAIVLFDNVADNGVVHVVSRVMYMAPELGSIATFTALPICRYVYYGIMDGGLVKMLNGKEPFTLFAPTDVAFEALPDKTKSIMYQNVTAIRRVMENHIVHGTYFTRGMFKGQRFTTVLGEVHTAVIDKGNISIDGSWLALDDFTASNGVLHFTSEVWVPLGLF